MSSLGDALQRAWWRPQAGALVRAMTPLAAIVSAVAVRRRRQAERTATAAPLPVPVLVVGNLVVGGAGKTPTVIALVHQLRAWGFTPGLVSRGYGRRDDDGAAMLPDDGLAPTTATRIGDEPLLMHRRTGAPVAVARDRRQAALRLLQAHPGVDVIVADDGLQHHALPRDLEVVVFDDRGLGNGHVLPAGPLREPPAALWPAAAGSPSRVIVLNGRWPPPPAPALPASAPAPWPARRTLAGAVALDAWSRGEPPTPASLHALRGRRVPAAAGIGHPARFFEMLAAEGLDIAPLPLPDHAAWDTLPWPEGTPDALVTEKDAVKLAGRPPAGTRVWVVPLDFAFDPGFLAEVRAALDAARASRSPSRPSSP